jgi:hypothetical protein
MSRGHRWATRIQFIVVIACAAAALALAPSARAGTFTIRGTCGLWDAFNAIPSRIAVYPDCPTLVARNVGGAVSTPAGPPGGWVFYAPGGTSIASFTIEGNFYGTSGWQAAGYTEGGAFSGVPFASCPGATCPGGYQHLLGAGFNGGGAGAVVLRFRCGSVNGCPNHALFGFLHLFGASVTLTDHTAPGVAITGGSLVAGEWRRGLAAVDFSASDNSGIKLVRAFVDGSPRAEAMRGCSYWQKAPCPNGPGSLAISTAGLADGAHTVTVQVIDAGNNAGAHSRTIYTDNTPPVQPQNVVLEAGAGWRSTNRFGVRWQSPRQSASPIAEAVYSICPAGSGPDVQRRCVSGSRAVGAGSISDLRVPASGAWVLRLWLRDRAGNANPDSAVVLPGLRFDAEPPRLSLAEPDPNDPARISVHATDATSGIARGEIELRRQGEGTWRSLTVELAANGFSGVIDDEHLPDGAYDVRARATDHAGNETSTETLANGLAATVALPVRLKTRLAVGKVKRIRARGSRRGRARYRRILVPPPRTRYGRTIRLRGRLTTPGANPVAGANLEVWEQLTLPGAEWRQIATIPTSRSGRFTFKALRGPSRLLRFRYPGTATVRARTMTVALRVRATSSIRPSRRHLVNGEEVTFHGRVKGGPIPAGGKLVELQVYTRRRWRTFAQPRASSRTGLWAYRYRFEAIRGRVTFRFRARIRKEAGYPYELGTSRRVRVTVRGV